MSFCVSSNGSAGGVWELWWKLWVTQALNRLMEAHHVWDTACVFVGFYVLATSAIISGRVLPCGSVRSRRPYHASLLGDLAISTMTWYPIQSHYHDTNLTSPCLILLMRSTRLRSYKIMIYICIYHVSVPTLICDNRLVGPIESRWPPLYNWNFPTNIIYIYNYIYKPL